MGYTLSFILFLMWIELSYGSESQCIQMSRFDYEYKMLQKMTECEIIMRDLQSKMKDHDLRFRDINAKISNYEDMERRVAVLERTKGNPENGVTYVRWGRTTCSGNGTDLVYSGYLGGSHHRHKGAATNYLCLPKNPDWDHFEGIASGGKIYGGEYEFDSGGGSGKAQRFFEKAGLDEQPPPCAVCASVRPMFMMIPGKNTCPDGWTKEYSGYLASGYHGNEAATEYVCVDRQPEIETEGKPQNNEGFHLYFVEAMCGTLPCPPYGQGRELTCVICTR